MQLNNFPWRAAANSCRQLSGPSENVFLVKLILNILKLHVLALYDDAV